MKRVLAILLSVLLMLALVPMGVFADGSDSNLTIITGAVNESQFEYLGRGFNALSGAAIAEETIEGTSILDYDKVKATVVNTSRTQTNAEFAKSAQELMLSFGIDYNNSESLSVPLLVSKVNFESKFGIKASLKYTHIVESQYFYYIQETITGAKALNLTLSDMNHPEEFISADFVEDLQYLNNHLTVENIDAFLRVWGTHILVDYNKGATLEYVSSYHSTSEDLTSNIDITYAMTESVGQGTKPEFEATQDIAVQVGVAYKDDDYNLSHQWYCTGGKSQLVANPESEDEMQAVQDWINSIEDQSALIPQSSQWKAVWEFIPAAYNDVKAAVQERYREAAVGVNVEFFEQFTTYSAVETTDVFYTSTATDAEGNPLNLTFKMDVYDKAEVAPGSAINVVNMGADLSQISFEVSPAAYGTVDASGVLHVSPAAQPGSEITVTAHSRLTDEALSQDVIQQRVYVVKTEGSPYREFAGGYGTKERPYLIATPEHLNNIRHYETDPENGNYYLLVEDIDLADFEMQPIPVLYGVLDGNDYTIKNWTFASTQQGTYGLFATNTGTVKNLKIEGFSITLKRDLWATAHIGCLVGNNEGTISNVHVTDSQVFVEAGDTKDTDPDNDHNKGVQVNAGGICGTNSGSIQKSGSVNCRIQAHAYADEYDENCSSRAGGVVGYATEGTTLEDVYSHDNTVESISKSGSGWIPFKYFGPTAYARAGGIIGTSVGHNTVTRALAYNIDYGKSASVYHINLEDLKTGAIYANHNYTTVTNGYTAPDRIRNLQEFQKNGWYEEELEDGSYAVRIARRATLSVNGIALDREYSVGEPLNLTGLSLVVFREGSNDPVEEVTGGFAVFGYDPNVVGEQTVTVTYGGALVDTYTVTVREPQAPQIVGLSILTLPHRTAFYEGAAINYTGLTAAVLMDNGETEAVALSDLKFSVEDIDSAGKRVVVFYEGFSDEFVIQIYPVSEDAPVFAVENATAFAGEEFTVAVLTERNSGIVSLSLKVAYDADVLTLVDYAQQDFENMVFSPITNNPIAINWVDAIHPNNTTDGVVALLTFRVKEDAPVGKTEIALSYDPEDVYDQNFDNVAFRTENGVVTIVDYTPGDVNGDGRINNKDLGLLQQYLADWDVTVDLSAADVNNDGKVNNKDLGRLQQYLADWDVVLG